MSHTDSSSADPTPARSSSEERPALEACRSGSLRRRCGARPPPPESVSSCPTSASPPPPTEPPVSTAGLVNEGCTCYLNALLQLLFHIGYFRSAVYRTPVPDGDGVDDGADGPRPSVHQAVQELFFRMQERTTPARALRLTESFGWGEEELLQQQDIQEMATLLRDNLEEQMKGTVTEGAIRQLFEGRGQQFVETLDRSYRSSSRDTFYDIHLPLSPYRNVMDSVRSLTARDQLVGDNKYRVEEEGKAPVYKEAEKGYRFCRFPPVTWFHLKRFSMDLTSPTLEMKKVHSRMEYPLVLDLTELEEGDEDAAGPTQEDQADSNTATTATAVTTSTTTTTTATVAAAGAAVAPLSAGAASPAVYDLHAVIVHRGTVRSGHYVCYIREWDAVAGSFDRWIEFDDEYVRVVSEAEAVRQHYGGDGSMSAGTAYLLSYVRRADAAALLAPSPTDIITERVKAALHRQLALEERLARRMLRQRARLRVVLLDDESIAAHCRAAQTDLFHRGAAPGEGAAAFHAAAAWTMRKTDDISDLYRAAAAAMAMRSSSSSGRRGREDPHRFRLWCWRKRLGYVQLLPVPVYGAALLSPQRLSALLAPLECDARGTHLFVYAQRALSDAMARATAVVAAAAVEPFVVSADCVAEGEGEAVRVRLRAPTPVSGLHLRLHRPPTAEEARRGFDEGVWIGCRVSVLLRGPHGEGAVHFTLPSDASTDAAPLALRIPSDRPLANCVEVRARALGEDGQPGEPLEVAAVHVQSHALPPASPPRRKIHLAAAGPARALLFFKLYDPLSATLRYVGSALLDNAGTLRSCVPLLYQLAGVDGGVFCEPGVAPPPGFFAFFLESRGGVERALPEDTDLFSCGLRSGATVIVQRHPGSLDFALCRHPHAETFLRERRATAPVRLVEVLAAVAANTDRYRTRLRALAADAKQRRQEHDQQQPQPQQEQHQKPQQSGRAEPNPYDVELPLLGALVVGPRWEAPVAVAPLCTLWPWELIFDAVAAATGADPTRLYLYPAVEDAHGEAGAPPLRPASQPLTPSEDLSLADVTGYDGAQRPPVTLFFERLPDPLDAPRGPALVVTLRDAAGHALLRERVPYDAQLSCQRLVRRALRSLLAHTSNDGGGGGGAAAPDPFGTMRATAAATHFVLAARVLDSGNCRIGAVAEVPLAAGVAAADAALPEIVGTSAWDVDVRPAAALSQGEWRLTCCHGDHRAPPARQLFGHPFVLTVGQRTTVREGLERMLAVTHVARHTLLEPQRYGAMMLTDRVCRFDDWGLPLVSYWTHSHNASALPPSLLLNRPRPAERPGARYVAHDNPKLKISVK